MVGGAGGLGRAAIKHFASLGAKHIITLSRSGPDSQVMRQLVEEMRMVGVSVIVWKGSVTDTATIKSIKEHAKRFPIKGVVQGAMVLQVSRNRAREKKKILMETGFSRGQHEPRAVAGSNGTEGYRNDEFA